MKVTKILGALLAALSMSGLADAGLLMGKNHCGAEKGCGCAPSCQPACCKPVIVKPCCPNVYTYQRKCSDIKPPCCDTCAPATCCAPAARPACAPACAAPAACAPAPAACAPACAAPAACAPAPAACAPACAAPAAACAPAACAPACAAPAAACAPRAACAPACAAPAACAPAACTPACAPACSPKKHGGLLAGLFNKKSNCNTCGATACAPACAAPAAATCAAPTTCAPKCEVRCCNADPCEVATLIYESQTACYAKDRRKAIHKLGDKFDCICNPEIMTAFIVGLNDCDERVRLKAADEIGDQIRKNCCCCPEVVAALTCALGDCDKHVVKQAKEALELCGYEVVDGCCNPCGNTATACGTNGCAPAAAAPAAAPAPAPVPPEGQARRNSLSNLLGLVD